MSSSHSSSSSSSAGGAAGAASSSLHSCSSSAGGGAASSSISMTLCCEGSGGGARGDCEASESSMGSSSSWRDAGRGATAPPLRSVPWGPVDGRGASAWVVGAAPSSDGTGAVPPESRFDGDGGAKASALDAPEGSVALLARGRPAATSCTSMRCAPSLISVQTVWRSASLLQNSSSVQAAFSRARDTHTQSCLCLAS